ncbi:MAG: PEGA domain-containing protein, partial [Candidatus Aenigmarchaeota archaeon]|nr:PEGA domain-containing protein [Candidatus Aenigmarchaeota archaeon]
MTKRHKNVKKNNAPRSRFVYYVAILLVMTVLIGSYQAGSYFFLRRSSELTGEAAAKIGQTGNLYVSSTPSLADLYVDKAYKGRTPITVKNLITGRHIIILTKVGYYPYNKLVNVYAKQTTSVHVKLIPIPPGNQTNQTGSLTVASSPPSANLYIDGAYKGSTSYTVSGLTVGNHNIDVT